MYSSVVLPIGLNIAWLNANRLNIADFQLTKYRFVDLRTGKKTIALLTNKN